MIGQTHLINGGTQTNGMFSNNWTQVPGYGKPPKQHNMFSNNWTQVPGYGKPPKQQKLEENPHLKFLRKEAGGGIRSLKKGALQRYLRELEKNPSNWKPKNYVATTHLRRMGVELKDTNNNNNNNNNNQNTYNNE